MYTAIAASQAVLFMLDSHIQTLRRSGSLDVRTVYTAVVGDCSLMRREREGTSDNRMMNSGGGSGDASVWTKYVFDHERQYTLTKVILETLRRTAHVIGAIRKVMSAEGYTITKETGEVYVLPQGSYIAASHIVPNMQALYNNTGNQSVFELPGDLLMTSPGDGSPTAPTAAPGYDYGNEYEFTTFSQGVHKCPGQMIATMVCTCFFKYMW